MDSTRLSEVFLTESREHLGALERLLEEWERNPSSPSVGGELLRCLHNLKAMASSMGYAQVGDLAHAMEAALQGMTGTARTPDPSMIHLLLRGTDALRLALEAASAQRPEQPDFGPTLQALRDAAGGREEKGSSRSAPASEQAPSDREGWLVRVRLKKEAELPGARSLLVLRRAARLGKVLSVQPPVTAFSHETFQGSFSFELSSPASPAEIERVLQGAGEIESVELNPISLPISPRGGRESGQVRIERERIERLVSLARKVRDNLAAIEAIAQAPVNHSLTQRVKSLSQLMESLESELRALRLTAAWRLFDRFPRVVRELSRILGKEVEFEIRGRELEVDRAILEQLADPILHLVRNAVDHGIEPPDERLRKGKSPAGSVVLEARRDRGRLLIQVRDDGRGIDRLRVLHRARKMGLVGPEVEELSDAELLRILAHPGFSTKDGATQVSGRGIGVDIVVSRIAELGGTVRLQTGSERGTVFELDLPESLHG